MRDSQSPMTGEPREAFEWAKPSWSGFVETEEDALLIFRAVREGIIPLSTGRFERFISSGSVFVFAENETGVERWTDVFSWSSPRVSGGFVLFERLGGEDLVKKMIRLTIDGVTQQLISYYKISDVESLCRPSYLLDFLSPPAPNGNYALPFALATTSDAKEPNPHDTAGTIQTAFSTASLLTDRPLTLSKGKRRSCSMSHAAHRGKELEALPWDTYEPAEFQTPWLLSVDLLHRHGLSLSRTKYYDDLRHNTDLPRRAAVEPFHPQNDEDFVHRLDEDWDSSVRVVDRIVTFFQESVFLNLALDQYRRHVIVKVILAEDIELQILKSLSLNPLRSDLRNHTIPVLQFIPGNGFEYSVQACWYEHWQWPPFDCATSRFEMARQLLEGLVFMHEHFIAHGDIHPRNILWNHAPTHHELSCHSKFDFRMAYIDFGGAVLFSAQNRRSLGSGVRPPSAWAAPEQSLGQLYDVCAADVCMLGKVLQGEMEEGRKWYNIPSDNNVYERYGTLLTEMTCAKPEDRPTATAALEAVQSIAQSTNGIE